VARDSSSSPTLVLMRSRRPLRKPAILNVTCRSAFLALWEFSTLLYIGVVLVLTGVTPFTRLNVPDPLAVAVDATSAHWLSPLVKAGAILGTTAVILVMMLGQTRVFYTMAFDGLLPKSFGTVHPRFRTPYKSTALVGFFVALGGGLIPLRIVGELVSIGTLLAFVIVCGSVLAMRRMRPDIRRPFRTPAVWFVAPMGMFVCLAQMVGLPLDTWIRLFVWMAIGFVHLFWLQPPPQSHSPRSRADFFSSGGHKD